MVSPGGPLLSSTSSRPGSSRSRFEPLRHANAVDPSAGFTIGGRCQPGDTSDEAFLYLEIDGEEVAAASASFGSSAGEVGLFAMGDGPEPVTVDLNDFEATGTRD